MARRVDQIEHVILPVLGVIINAHRVGLDGDAALALDVHGIQQLFFHVPRLDRAGGLDQPVGKGRLAVVDMRDDGKIADLGKLGHGAGIWGKTGGWSMGELEGFQG